MSFLSYAPSLTSSDVERFSRQIMCEGIGAEGMERIKNGHVVCVGLGGLGSTIALYLAAAGVGKLTFVDHDEVEVSNLHRQVIHNTSAVRQPKAVSAKHACQALNPNIVIEDIQEMISFSNARRLFNDCDVVVDGTDNVASRYLINDMAMLCGKPLVSGSAMRWEGQLSVYGYDGGPCYRCIFPVPPPHAAVGSCNDTGVIGPLPGMIGCLQAMEALKLLARCGETLSGRMFLFDGKRFTSRVIKLRGKKENCEACSVEVLKQSELPPREEYVPADCCVGAAFSATLLPDKNHRISIGGFATALVEQEKKLLEAMQAPGLHSVKQLDIVVDVRAAIQFKMAYLPNSFNLPLSELQKWVSEGGESCRVKFSEFVESCLKLSVDYFINDKERTNKSIKSNTDSEHRLNIQSVRIFFICRRGVASAKATELFYSSIQTAIAEKEGQTEETSCKKTKTEFSLALNGEEVGVSAVNVDGGLNSYHCEIDQQFPYY